MLLAVKLSTDSLAADVYNTNEISMSLKQHLFVKRTFCSDVRNIQGLVGRKMCLDNITQRAI